MSEPAQNPPELSPEACKAARMSTSKLGLNPNPSILPQELPKPGADPTQAPSDPLKHERELPPGSAKDRDRLGPLVAEALSAGGCVLIFCGSRHHCQQCAKLLVEELPTFMGPAWQVGCGV